MEEVVKAGEGVSEVRKVFVHKYGYDVTVLENEEAAKKLQTERNGGFKLRTYIERDISVFQNFPQFCGNEPRIIGILGVEEGWVAEEGFSHHWGRVIIIRRPDVPVPALAPAGKHMTDLEGFGRDPDVQRHDFIIVEIDDGHVLEEFRGAAQIYEAGDAYARSNGAHWYFEHYKVPEADGMAAQNCLAYAISAGQ